MKLTVTGLAILTLAAAILLGIFGLVEGFGSPGTYTQLATSHVPTSEDANYFQNVYPREVRAGLKQMTGEDPGPIRTFLTPYAGTYYLW
jgi:hypothetical protein